MSETTAKNTDISSLTRHIIIGAIAIFGVFGSLLFWAYTFNIAGAVLASGTVVVESHAKSIQHRDGGIISQIFVQNEDFVTKGQLLALLDDTDISANHTVIETLLNRALAKEVRLLAEIGNKEMVSLEGTSDQITNTVQYSYFLQTEAQIFAARKTTRQRRVQQISEQIVQTERQIDGIDLQRKAIETQLHILNQEITSLAALYESKLVEIRRVDSLRKDAAAKEGELGQLLSAKAQARALIAEKRLQIEQIQDVFFNEALTELQDTRQQITRGVQEFRASTDKIKRTELRAPATGVVHQSKLHTIGGVISPGETVMLLVPQDEDLAIDIKINPIDVDKAFIGQDVVLRLSSFDQLTTPEVNGTIAQIAPDVSMDQITREQYFGVRIVIPKTEFGKLPKSTTLLPGMPVDAFIKTEDRTILSYLVQPFTDQLSRAFRED